MSCCKLKNRKAAALKAKLPRPCFLQIVILVFCVCYGCTNELLDRFGTILIPSLLRSSLRQCLNTTDPPSSFFVSSSAVPDRLFTTNISEAFSITSKTTTTRTLAHTTRPCITTWPSTTTITSIIKKEEYLLVNNNSDNTNETVTLVSVSMISIAQQSLSELYESSAFVFSGIYLIRIVLTLVIFVTPSFSRISRHVVGFASLAFYFTSLILYSVSRTAIMLFICRLCSGVSKSLAIYVALKTTNQISTYGGVTTGHKSHDGHDTHDGDDSHEQAKTRKRMDRFACLLYYTFVATFGICSPSIGGIIYAKFSMTFFYRMMFVLGGNMTVWSLAFLVLENRLRKRTARQQISIAKLLSTDKDIKNQNRGQANISLTSENKQCVLQASPHIKTELGLLQTDENNGDIGEERDNTIGNVIPPDRDLRDDSGKDLKIGSFVLVYFKQPIVYLMLMNLFVSSLTMTGRSTSMSIWIQAKFGVAELEVSTAMANSIVFGVLIIFLGLLVSNFLPRHRYILLMLSSAFAATSWMVFPFWRSWQHSTISLSFGYFALINEMIAINLCFEHMKKRFGEKYIGAVSVFCQLGLSVFHITVSMLSGIISDYFGFETVCIGAACLLFTTAGLNYRLRNYCDKN